MKTFVLELVTEPLDFRDLDTMQAEIHAAFSRSFAELSPPCEAIEVLISYRRIVVTTGWEDTSPPSLDALARHVLLALKGIESKSMVRWGSGQFPFYRPILRIFCMLSMDVVPFELEGVVSGCQASRDYFNVETLDDASQWRERMKQYFEPSLEKRETQIIQTIRKVASALGKTPFMQEERMRKLAFISEHPTILPCTFDRDDFSIPDHIVERVLWKFEMMEPLYKEGKVLSDMVLLVLPVGGKSEQEVCTQYRRVLRSALSDIEAVYAKDAQNRLVDYKEKLKWISERESLGSLYEKNERLRVMIEKVSASLSLADEMETMIEEAANVMKADLATRTVKRYPNLRGEVAYEMLLAEKRSPVVARMVKEQYLPDENGILPSSMPGAILAICDRFDDIVGTYISGGGQLQEATTRRKMDEILDIIEYLNVSVSTQELIDDSLFAFTEESRRPFDYLEMANTLRDLFKRRLKAKLRGRGVLHTVLEDTYLRSDCSIPELIRALEKISSALEGDPQGQRRDVFDALGILRKRWEHAVEGQTMTDEEPLAEEKRLMEIFDHLHHAYDVDSPDAFLSRIEKYRGDVDALVHRYEEGDLPTVFARKLLTYEKEIWI